MSAGLPLKANLSPALHELEVVNGLDGSFTEAGHPVAGQQLITRSMCDAITLDEAYKRGDLEALKRLLRDPPDFPNCRGPAGLGEIILEYAIYHSPLPFIRALLELGADPNYQDHAGFPALIAALSSDRPDRYQLIELLLAFGADIQEHGLNDWTPLHYAAATDDVEGIELLLAHGADPNARTRIDDYATPLEEAELLGRAEAARLLRKLAPG